VSQYRRAVRPGRRSHQHRADAADRRAAVAVNEQGLIASLVRREGESFPDLLQRLDTVIGKALQEGVVTNEINGGRFRFDPLSIRKKR
jgi:hypothetical protein